MILPFVRELFADVEKQPSFARTVPHLKTGAGRIRLSGLTPTAKAMLIPLLYRAAGRPLIVVVPRNRSAEELLPVLRGFCELTGAASPEGVVALPTRDVLPFQNLSPHPEIQEARAVALWKIATGAAQIVVAPAPAAAMKLREPEYYAGLARTIRRGEPLDIDELVQHLNTVGYTRADVVEMPGEYAMRGGILDVYPPEADRPVRVEFFGDEVESIRKFDPATQRSQASVDEPVLLPLTDTPVTEATLAHIHARLSGKRIAGSEEIIEDALRSGGVSVFPGWEFYAPLAGEPHVVFDLMPNAAILVDEPADVGGELDHFWERVREVHERSQIGNLVRPEDLYLSPDNWKDRVRTLSGADLEHLGIGAAAVAPSSPAAGPDVAPVPSPAVPDIDSATPPWDLPGGGQASFAAPVRTTQGPPLGAAALQLLSQPAQKFHGAVPAFVDTVKKLASEGQHVVFAAASIGEVERLADLFGEYGVTYRLGTRSPRPGQSEDFLDEATYVPAEYATTTIVKAYVPDGVVLPDAKLVLFGTRDLFDEAEAGAVQAPSGRKSKTAAFMSDFRDLAVGDYVVHVEHGIGQYVGLKEIPQQDGGTAEFMILEYAEGAKLYVPLTRLDLVQKYRSAEGAKPALSRLGTQAWAKTKARVKKAMKDMADELLKLYAERRMVQGHAFPNDTEWQREFEDAFEFNETEDQIQAIADIKTDMEATTPMDRLLCGDVGYGKTEVAMRAAFKAVSDNKQVAVLAPTTVLAFQHYETFKRRFAAFPLTIEMISRFRSPKQQKEIVEKVEQGKVDILIGTHRLLSKDISFPDLGLVVVDEEQRFGVRHKERLKQLKKQVDVLTMSATPIPRTLHMSLVGLRDMSVIETPPKDRMAIQTVVAPWDNDLIKAAIEHELERGGQAYFVHNRVESIYEIAAKIQEMVPHARILVGHGQMSENELEKVMLAFIRHEADVLVATTIIENGLDIPLCNTMLINRADRHGLSELYQLRGRVGRSNRRAYAYLLIPPDTELTPIARRRLAALKEFSDLGAGFKIAALDLELRGAGNLLGGEQSGHIDAVGFELYTSMLERTIKEIRGEVREEEVEVQLNLGINIRIPADYIKEENQRLRMYKRVAGVSNEKQLEDVKAEIADRYGPPPQAVLNLEEYAALRLLCRRVGVHAIDRKRDQVIIKFAPDAQADPQRLARFVATDKGAQFSPSGVLKFSSRASTPEGVLTTLRDLIEQLAAEEEVVPTD
jgi:transcription-repair coupling factor (superfamily II helicase)